MKQLFESHRQNIVLLAETKKIQISCAFLVPKFPVLIDI